MTMQTVDAIDTRTGATVPVQVETGCTIEHDGRSFTAGGAFISPDYVIAYVAGEVNPDGTKPYRGPLTDWHGNRIGTWTLESSWKQIAPYGEWASRYTMRAITATVNGRRYFGRYNYDGGTLVKLRACKHQDA